MALGQDIERLQRVPLLQCLEPDALRLLAFSGGSRIVAADTTLFRAGEPSEGAYLVVTGSFTVARPGGAVALIEAGRLVGEPALLRDVPHAETATAAETATVFALPRVVMLRVLEEHPQSAKRVLAFVARRLRAALRPAGGRTPL